MSPGGGLAEGLAVLLSVVVFGLGVAALVAQEELRRPSLAATLDALDRRPPFALHDAAAHAAPHATPQATPQVAPRDGARPVPPSSTATAPPRQAPRSPTGDGAR